MEIGKVIGVRDNRNPERIFPGVENREAHAVNANRSLFDGNIAG